MPIITYNEFRQILNSTINENMLYDLLVTIIKYPQRYTGLFRISNPHDKLIQNLTQSREIKFGYFMEKLIRKYIERIGLNNLDPNLGINSNNDSLMADQLFQFNNNIVLIEQKIRDDHDSSKKRGQFNNFVEKINVLSKQYGQDNVVAIMWFIDDTTKKNKKYYEDEKEKFNQYNIQIFYGKNLFTYFFNREDIWVELTNYLKKYKKDSVSSELIIPDLDTSDEFFIILQTLKRQEPKLFKKLISNNDKYIELRKTLFPTGFNFNRLVQ